MLCADCDNIDIVEGTKCTFSISVDTSKCTSSVCVCNLSQKTTPVLM